jgi:hypothetical protein
MAENMDALTHFLEHNLVLLRARAPIESVYKLGFHPIANGTLEAMNEWRIIVLGSWPGIG